MARGSGMGNIKTIQFLECVAEGLQGGAGGVVQGAAGLARLPVCLPAAVLLSACPPACVLACLPACCSPACRLLAPPKASLRLRLSTHSSSVFHPRRYVDNFTLSYCPDALDVGLQLSTLMALQSAL